MTTAKLTIALILDDLSLAFGLETEVLPIKENDNGSLAPKQTDLILIKNSMFKQFFGACNQLDWSVLKIRNKCTNLFVGGSITYPKGTLANKFWYPLHS